MAIKISSKIQQKLRVKHSVGEDEIIQAFANRTRTFLEDTREEHKTNPPSLWFVAQTDKGIRLKVVFILQDKDIHIKTAYPATEEVQAMYKRKAPSL